MQRPLIVFLESYVAGGADQVVASLLPYLVKRRPIEVFVNARSDTSVLLAKPLPPGVGLHYYAWPNIAEWANWSRQAGTSWGRLWRQFLTLSLRYPWLMFLTVLLFFRLRALAPCAVWVNNGGYPGGDTCRVATVAAGWLRNCRVIHVVHSMAQSPRILVRPFEWLLDRLVDRSATVVAVSNAVARSLTDVRDIRQVPMVIYNGLNDSFPTPPPPAVGPILRVLQVGYLDSNKNQALSISALGMLKQNGIRSIELLLVGKEVELGFQAELEALAERLGVSNQIRFSGFVKNVDPFYTACDVVVLTSKVEGLPMCLIEAMRAGRAVVSTRVGGVPELVVEGETGWLLCSSGSEELAQIFRHLLERKEILILAGAAARLRFMAEFQLSRQVSEYANLLGISAEA
ncbi:glycosyltransferase [Sulfurirhabdus autotrophica]|nr:glycosyltransferase [Sulfurirhabdus autotrophica]